MLEKGYPLSHIKVETLLLRFGHKGRNSFRTDIAVLDVPVSAAGDLDQLKSHVKLVAEIKRENATASLAKQTQVRPALELIPDIAALGLYWDDIERRLFYRILQGSKTATRETTALRLPRWGERFGGTPIRTSMLQDTNLLPLFKKVEERLHPSVSDKSRRFEIMLQLLLAKLYDEHNHLAPDDVLDFDDFSDSPLSDQAIADKLDQLLGRAARFYSKYLPKKIAATFDLDGSLLRSLSALIGPVRVLGARHDMMQTFYMHFAKGMYKWDLAQYFTPYEVIDFIVAMANPKAGDLIRDPACGSADFLVASLARGRSRGLDLSDALWGSDNSDNAVQVAMLNMLLNGDGKANLKKEDSLEKAAAYKDFTVVLCNPPFGVRIKELRFDVLQKFDLGHEWATQKQGFDKTNKIAKSQETGVLFAELCVRQTAPGGRVAIILPNGYLGNRSSQYQALREWLMRHTRVVAIVGFPRFTFKKSGADVSASVLLLEKRLEPLRSAKDSADYPVFVTLLESVGWDIGNKKAERILKHDPETGARLTTPDNDEILDADFDRALRGLATSKVAQVFGWLERADLEDNEHPGWTIQFNEVLSRPDLSIDPKRWCGRTVETRRQIQSMPHLRLGDILEVVGPEKLSWDKSAVYQYVELGSVSDGIVTPAELRGWQLPARGKLRAKRGDLFVGGVWGSVGKWFVAGGDCDHFVVTNGFHRLRMRPGKESSLADVLAAINTEAYRVQARALSTGSDGLAEFSGTDLVDIVIPKVTDAAARKVLDDLIVQLRAGRTTVANVVRALQHDKQVPTIVVKQRSGPFVQV